MATPFFLSARDGEANAWFACEPLARLETTRAGSAPIGGLSNQIFSFPPECLMRSRRLHRRDRGHVDDAARGDRDRQHVRGFGRADEDRADGQGVGDDAILIALRGAQDIVRH